MSKMSEKSTPEEDTPSSPFLDCDALSAECHSEQCRAWFGRVDNRNICAQPEHRARFGMPFSPSEWQRWLDHMHNNMHYGAEPAGDFARDAERVSRAAMAVTRRATDGVVQFPSAFADRPLPPWARSEFTAYRFLRGGGSDDDADDAIVRRERIRGFNPFPPSSLQRFALDAVVRMRRQHWARDLLFGDAAATPTVERLGALAGATTAATTVFSLRQPPPLFAQLMALYDVPHREPDVHDLMSVFVAFGRVAAECGRVRTGPRKMQRSVARLFGALTSCDGRADTGTDDPKSFLWETVSAVRRERCAHPNSRYYGMRFVPWALAFVMSITHHDRDQKSAENSGVLRWMGMPDRINNEWVWDDAWNAGQNSNDVARPLRKSNRCLSSDRKSGSRRNKKMRRIS